MKFQEKGTPRKAEVEDAAVRVKEEVVFDIDQGIQDLLKHKDTSTIDQLNDIVAACCLQACDCCLQIS